MDDSSSIVRICINLRNGISLLVSDLQRSTAGSRQASSELRRLPSELASLHLTVGALQISYGQISSIPITLRTNLESVMTGCSHVVQEMRDVIVEDRESPSNTERSAMRRLLTALEAHRSAIQIALELLLVTTTEQTSDLQTLQAEAGQISSQPQTRDQVFTMLREIRVLQLQVTQLSQASDSNGIPLQRFLEDVSEYADSVFQDADSNGMRIEITQDLDAESDLGNFHSARESFVIPSRPTSQSDPDTTHNFELLPVHTREDAYAQAPAHNFTPPQPIIPPGLLPSTSSLSAHSSWTYTSIRLRISNRLYSFRTASDTTRNILSAVTFLDPAVRAVRLARTQGVLPLAPSQKAWIDQQIAFAEESMDRAAQLVEPARVDLQTRADLRFVRKVQFVLRDSPRIQACFEQLSAAGAGLNAAANLLYGPASTRDGDGDSISTMDIPAPPYSLSLRGEYLG